MYLRPSFLTLIAAALLLGGCVPMSQFTEVRDDRDALDSDVATLTEQVQALRLAVAEKDGLLREDGRRMDGLRADTSNAGSRLRQCQMRYAELEELNNLLSAELENKRSSSGAEQAALLEELQRIRANLQFQQDSLYALEQDLRARESKVAELSNCSKPKKQPDPPSRSACPMPSLLFETGDWKLKSAMARSTSGCPPTCSLLPAARP